MPASAPELAAAAAQQPAAAAAEGSCRRGGGLDAEVGRPSRRLERRPRETNRVMLLI